MPKNPFLLPEMSPERHDLRQTEYVDICNNPNYGPIAQELFVSFACLREQMKRNTLAFYRHSEDFGARSEEVRFGVVSEFHATTYVLTTHESGVQSGNLEADGYDLYISKRKLKHKRRDVLFERSITIRAVDCGGGEYGLVAAEADTLSLEAYALLQGKQGVDVDEVIASGSLFTLYDAQKLVEDINTISDDVKEQRQK